MCSLSSVFVLFQLAPDLEVHLVTDYFDYYCSGNTGEIDNEIFWHLERFSLL